MVERTKRTRLGAGLLCTVVLSTAGLATGCGSSDSKDDASGRVEKAPEPAKPDAKPRDSEQLEPITIKKGDRHMTEAAYPDKPDPGNVSIDFRNADLQKVALPLFSKQADVTVEYGGPPKNLSLRLLNVPWRDALLEICRFTQTHVVPSQVHGRLELKLGASDSKPLLDRFDPRTGGVGPDAAGPESVGTSASAGSGASSSSSGSTGGATSPPPGGGDTIEDPNAAGKATIERLRTGVSTTSSGQ